MNPVPLFCLVTALTLPGAISVAAAQTAAQQDTGQQDADRQAPRAVTSASTTQDGKTKPAAPKAGKKTGKKTGDDAGDDKDDDDDNDDDDDDSKSSDDSSPTIYIDLETSWSSTPGNTVGFGLRNLRHLTGDKSRGLYMSAPLTIDLTDRISVYAGFDGSAAQTPGEKWSQYTPGSWIVGGSAEMIEQTGYIPGVTLSASVSRPFDPIALGVFTTTWSGGVDLDYAFDKDQTRGITAGFSFSRTMVSSHLARVGAQTGAYIGGYWSPADQINLTAQLGVQYFDGAEAASLVRLKPVTTSYVMFEVEHVDDDDNRIFAVNLGFGWSPKPVVQISLSTPLYLAR